MVLITLFLSQLLMISRSVEHFFHEYTALFNYLKFLMNWNCLKKERLKLCTSILPLYAKFYVCHVCGDIFPHSLVKFTKSCSFGLRGCFPFPLADLSMCPFHCGQHLPILRSQPCQLPALQPLWEKWYGPSLKMEGSISYVRVRQHFLKLPAFFNIDSSVLKFELSLKVQNR